MSLFFRSLSKVGCSLRLTIKLESGVTQIANIQFISILNGNHNSRAAYHVDLPERFLKYINSMYISKHMLTMLLLDFELIRIFFFLS